MASDTGWFNPLANFSMPVWNMKATMNEAEEKAFKDGLLQGITIGRNMTTPAASSTEPANDSECSIDKGPCCLIHVHERFEKQLEESRQCEKKLRGDYKRMVKTLSEDSEMWLGEGEWRNEMMQERLDAVIERLAALEERQCVSRLSTQDVCSRPLTESVDNLNLTTINASSAKVAVDFIQPADFAQTSKSTSKKEGSNQEQLTARTEHITTEEGKGDRLQDRLDAAIRRIEQLEATCSNTETQVQQSAIQWSENLLQEAADIRDQVAIYPKLNTEFAGNDPLETILRYIGWQMTTLKLSK
ncbi:hypothetical protein BJ508DRAFT_329166 [Ascobolus immersus RN42]|uniref:Uncharacterized protein n=1 Tax=Ascobolus immersus RN42 TaxID=1160509 RepID=A0A3N4HXG6_ASCIM|nr:hypothetical protein BJ508DRAFT_329166 [Ascobolus immersus RN42]